jgi:hypothetical protein
LDKEVFEESLVNGAVEEVRKAFSSKDGNRETARLVKTIAALVDRPKEAWPLGLIRRIADSLLSLSPLRGRSLDHEARWLNLIGFCMRPGFGDALDGHRMETLWKIFHEGLVHGRHAQVRSEWWVLWRRVAGGLSAGQQMKALQEISLLIRPGKGGKKGRLAAQEDMEIWMTVANLERVPVNDKVVWGKRLLDSLQTQKGRPQYWWSLSRIGAREPLYGPIDRIVPPDVIVSWIDRILTVEWRDPRPVGAALAQMARLTGDRKRDLGQELVDRVIDWIASHDWSGPCLKPLKEIVPIDQHEESLIFGESLPSGIQLRMD